MFRVDPKTVTRWAAAGKLGSVRTPGGHRRFREAEVRALLDGSLEPKPSLESQERWDAARAAGMMVPDGLVSDRNCTCEQEVWTPDTPRGDDGLDHHPKCPVDKARPELSNGALNVVRANHSSNMGGRS